MIVQHKNAGWYLRPCRAYVHPEHQEPGVSIWGVDLFNRDGQLVSSGRYNGVSGSRKAIEDYLRDMVTAGECVEVPSIPGRTGQKRADD